MPAHDIEVARSLTPPDASGPKRAIADKNPIEHASVLSENPTGTRN
jgi:hypothetical protein